MRTVAINFNCIVDDSGLIQEGVIEALRKLIRYSFVCIVTTEDPENVSQFLSSKTNNEFQFEINQSMSWSSKGVIGIGNFVVKSRVYVDRNAVYHKNGKWNSTSQVVSKILRTKPKYIHSNENSQKQ